MSSQPQAASELQQPGGMLIPAPALVNEAPGQSTPAWLRKGFRPFFLGAAGFCAAAVPAWALAFAGWAGHPRVTVGWHAHEMLFGFAVAVIAGFLLTAVANWTGRETPTGYALLSLFGLWLAGRLIWLVGGVSGGSPVISAIVDTSFLFVLAAVLARPIIATRNFRNLPLVAVVLALAACNVIWHYGLIWSAYPAILLAQQATTDLVLLLIVVMTGRVVPMFTRNGLGDPSIMGKPAAERASVALMLLVLLGNASGVLASSPVAAAVLFGLLSVVLAVRSYSWGSLKSRREPLLWVLHWANLWLILGMALRGFGALGWTSPSVALHALTVGTIASVCFGMMCRVTLGHTGRALRAPRAAVASFWLLAAATLVRVVGPVGAPELYSVWIVCSGVLLSAAAVAFLLACFGPLVSPRVDGRAG